jgi:hypothetical protein
MGWENQQVPFLIGTYSVWQLLPVCKVNPAPQQGNILQEVAGIHGSCALERAAAVFGLCRLF